MDHSVKGERIHNPRSNANVFEILTFSWMFNLFRKGRKKDLDENDLYTTLDDQTASPLGDELEKKWKLELAKACKTNRKPSLLRALMQMFGAKYMFYGFLLAIEEIVLRMSQPLFIGGLLAYFNVDGSNKTIEYAYMCASGIVFSMLASLVLRHSTSIAISNCGMKTRVACCSAIFRKALRLSHTALGETTTGQMINLLSNDVNRFDMGLFSLHYIWIGPLQTVLVTYFLWQEIGVSSILGIATLLFLIPLQGWLGKKVFQLRFKTARKTDERGRLMNEIIAGIQVIKMYTWEKPFAKIIEYARKKEVRQIRGTSYINAISFMFRGIQIRLQLFISILSYVLLGNNISIQKVFVITSFYNLLQNTMSLFFCIGTAQGAELLVSIKRIQSFLLLEEKDVRTTVGNVSKPFDGEKISNGGSGGGGGGVEQLLLSKENAVADGKIDAVEMKKRSGPVPDGGSSIVISNATATWTDDPSASNSLEDINLTVSPGRLVAIIGPVGAGKSSLIQLILRELPLSSGKISVKGVVSYASQEPWLFTGSVRQNILFGSPMDADRYDQVVNVCALQDDFRQFPYGDRTTVGERGVTLSGGQRARINLARAIYKEADIYLLDDPLSAVDSRVGKYLFEKCIKGYLKEKLCVLVTHQIHLLANVDQIVLMENAKISAEGSYQVLQASGVDFAKFLGTLDETEAIDSDANEPSKSPDGLRPLLGPRDSDDSGVSSCAAVNKPSAAAEEPKEVAEIRSSGRISKGVYASYFSAVGSTCNVFCFFFMYVLTQALTTGGDYWISFWVNQEEYVFRYNNYSAPAAAVVDNSTSTVSFSQAFDALLSSLNSRLTCIVVYTVLVILLIVATFVRSAIFVSVCTKASLNLHNRMFNAIIRATMYFFNTNSSGRILNRFTNDMGAVDEILPSILLDVLQTGMRILAIFIVVGLVDFYLIIPTIVVGVIFYFIRAFYLPTSRSVKRLEGVARSPVFSHMNASIQGLTTIRAFGAEQTISNEFDKHQDSHSSTWYLFVCSNEAFGFWLDIVCFSYMCIVIFSFLVINNDTYGGYVGLAITQTVGLVGVVQWEIRQLAALENQMTSVERVLGYTNCPQESDFEYYLKFGDKTPPPKEWPNSGTIVFENFNLRYSSDSPYVLKNLNFRIGSKEKVGIVGRTGAGKSSIIAALFRLALNEGNIIIDDINIHELRLHDLRSKLSIIPQEPVLFSGTMRKNLDPFDEYPDHVLWNALEEVELKAVIDNLPDGLNSKMSESGSNFSVGQKQLVCLARALVRNNRILVLDEATANVDAQTDALIQNTIRDKFRDCTVLTVAHRLNTVMDSDRVLVMDAGSVVEFDHPFNLLKNTDGLLFSMVEQTGLATSKVLHNIASESCKNNTQAGRNSPIKLIDEDVDTVSNETS